MTKKLLPFAFLLFALASCKQNKSPLAEYGHIFESVVLYDQGAFRGYDLGDSLKRVTSKELGKPIEQDADYLYYEYKIDSATTYNIIYRFDEKGGLNEIQSDIFMTNIDGAEETFNKFKEYFDGHYGQSETQGGFNVWSVKSDKYNEVKIYLNNEVPAFASKNTFAKISLLINSDQF